MDHKRYCALPATDLEEHGFLVKNGFLHYNLPVPEPLHKNVSCPGPGTRRRYVDDESDSAERRDHAAVAAQRVEMPARPETIGCVVDAGADLDHSAIPARRAEGVDGAPADAPVRVEVASRHASTCAEIAGRVEMAGLNEPARVVMMTGHGVQEDYQQWKFEAPGGGADRLLGAGGRSVPAWLADNMEGDATARPENDFSVKNTFLHFDFEPQPLTDKMTSCPPQWTYDAFASFDIQRHQPSILSPMESVPEHSDNRAVVRPGTFTATTATTSTDTPTTDQSTRGQRKFVCTFWVGIEDDDMFRVAKRLIGPQGKYLKRIADVARGTRLRLRGRGSSPNSPTIEPLHLRVSSPHIDSFHLAKKRVGELLARIYADYFKMTGLKIVPHCVDEYPVPVFLDDRHHA